MTDQDYLTDSERARLREIARAWRQNGHGLPTTTDIAYVLGALDRLLDETEELAALKACRCDNCGRWERASIGLSWGSCDCDYAIGPAEGWCCADWQAKEGSEL